MKHDPECPYSRLTFPFGAYCNCAAFGGRDPNKRLSLVMAKVSEAWDMAMLSVPGRRLSDEEAQLLTRVADHLGAAHGALSELRTEVGRTDGSLCSQAEEKSDAIRREGFVQGIARCMGILAEYGGDEVRASYVYDRLAYLKSEAEEEVHTCSHSQQWQGKV